MVGAHPLATRRAPPTRAGRPGDEKPPPENGAPPAKTPVAAIPQEVAIMAFQISARSSAIGALLLAAGCMSGDGTGSKVDFGTGTNGAAAGSGTGSSAPLQVSQKTLLSDQAGVGNSVSTALINPWGIVAYQGNFWIANEGTGKVSIVDGAGVASTGKPASNQLDLGEGITGIAINDS